MGSRAHALPLGRHHTWCALRAPRGVIGDACDCGVEETWRIPSVHLVVPGVPATKKNHSKLVHSKKHGGRLVPVPSDWYMDFQQRTRAAWLTRKPSERRVLPDQLYNVQALIFLPVRFASRQYGDASGYYDAVGDALEAAGVISNDKWIESWDGSHRFFDDRNPRVELIITPLQGGAPV